MYFGIVTTHLIKEGSGSGDIFLGTDSELHQPPLGSFWELSPGKKGEPWKSGILYMSWLVLENWQLLDNRPRIFILFYFLASKNMAHSARKQALLPRTEGCLGAQYSYRIFPSSWLWMFPSRSFVKKQLLQLLARKRLFATLQLAIHFNHYLILKTL